MTTLELAITLLIVGIGIGFYIADMRATRRYRNEAIARRLSALIRH